MSSSEPPRPGASAIVGRAVGYGKGRLGRCALLAGVVLRRDFDVSQLNPLQVDRLALDASQRSIDEDTVVVNHVDNSAELALLLTVVDERDASKFNKALEGHGWSTDFCKGRAHTNSTSAGLSSRTSVRQGRTGV